MSGPDHYRTAETLLVNLRDELPSGALLRTQEQRTQMCAEAQVHATLALAAATAEHIGARGPGDLTPEWQAVVWPQGGAA